MIKARRAFSELTRAPGHLAGACSLDYSLVFERDAFRIAFLKPRFRGVLVRENLQVVLVANVLARIDIDQNGHRWSLLSLRRPQ